MMRFSSPDMYRNRTNKTLDICAIVVFIMFEVSGVFAYLNIFNNTKVRTITNMVQTVVKNRFSALVYSITPKVDSNEGHAPIIREYKQSGESKESDDDDADADKNKRNQNRQPVQKSSWERVLAKFSELSARLDKLEAK